MSLSYGGFSLYHIVAEREEALTPSPPARREKT